MTITTPSSPLSRLQQQQFEQDGFLVVPNIAGEETCKSLLNAVSEALTPHLAPLEYEVDVDYPGAPTHLNSKGGRTPRRLLNAYARDAVFRQWARNTTILDILRQLMACEQLQLTQSHHNCIMTKFPHFSSETHWHQDIRYWSFDRPELVSVWLALGEETPEKGGMQLVPGSHRLQLDRSRFDASLFLRTDLPENQRLLNKATAANLRPGDVLFFHCQTVHAAGANTATTPKFSLVFSYHAIDNQPIPETRSARYHNVPLE